MKKCNINYYTQILDDINNLKKGNRLSSSSLQCVCLNTSVNKYNPMWTFNIKKIKIALSNLTSDELSNALKVNPELWDII